MTLMEESISSYCEPFGKALAPPLSSSGAESTPTPSSSKSRHSTTSAESELEALIIIPNGKHSPKEHKLEEDIPPMMPLLPPILTPTTNGTTNGGGDTMSTAFNTNGDSHCNGNGTSNGKKVPPKTLPKPKVRPLPPPKPSKSSMLKKPVVFQDEGADGSEVWPRPKKVVRIVIWSEQVFKNKWFPQAFTSGSLPVQVKINHKWLVHVITIVAYTCEYHMKQVIATTGHVINMNENTRDYHKEHKTSTSAENECHCWLLLCSFKSEKQVILWMCMKKHLHQKFILLDYGSQKDPLKRPYNMAF